MEIQINKNELASALPALGKLITRTAVAEVCRSVEIRGFANHLYFRTRTIFEEIEFALFAEMEEDFPTTLVFFEQFRSVVQIFFKANAYAVTVTFDVRRFGNSFSGT